MPKVPPQDVKSDVYIRPGWIKHEIPNAIAAANNSISSTELYNQFRKKAQGLTQQQFVSRHLDVLVFGGLAVYEHTRWSLTADGFAKMKKADSSVQKGPKVLPRQVVHTGTYSGDELKPNCYRPGAYDAFHKPSRMGNQLIYKD